MFERLPGFRDFYPEECLRRNYLFRHWTEQAKLHDFSEYDIPTLEPLDLFKEKSGDEIVGQLFHFEDQGGRAVALRPELTPSLARMVGARANSLKRPIKWFNIAENFRYERQQKGRLRSHYQFNGDIFGEAEVGAEAEIISLAIESLRRFGLTEKQIVLRLSDRTLWITFLEAWGFEGERALGILGLVDKMERLPEEAVLEKLKPFFGDATAESLASIKELSQIRTLEALTNFFKKLLPESHLRDRLLARLQDWKQLLALLEASGVLDFVRIDMGIVRGLAYYTGFVFEIFALDGKGNLEGRALAGGGRYDHLIGKLGYPEMPAVGFGMGDVTLTDFLEERKLLPPLIEAPDIYQIFGGEAERLVALEDANLLRRQRLRVSYGIKAVGFGKQFKLAGQSGARFGLIYGSDELAKNSVKIRDFRQGGEMEVNRAQLLPTLEHIWSDGIGIER